jgi:hypothetical protein
LIGIVFLLTEEQIVLNDPGATPTDEWMESHTGGMGSVASLSPSIEIISTPVCRWIATRIPGNEYDHGWIYSVGPPGGAGPSSLLLTSSSTAAVDVFFFFDGVTRVDDDGDLAAIEERCEPHMSDDGLNTKEPKRKQHETTEN